MKKIISFLLIFTLAYFAFAAEGEGKKVAVIKIARGQAKVIDPAGESHPAKKGLWVTQGSVIKTAAKSFVRLSFIDKSTVNIGPKSEMKIEKFSKEEAGVLNVISGKIRSKVTKDYLQIEKDKSKLFVKSKQAVMGVRGTDFTFTVARNTGATTAVLFEGSIAFNKLNKKNIKNSLENIVRKGHMIMPGQFSVARHDISRATRPQKLNTQQFRTLEKNENFIAEGKGKKKKAMKSIVPPGLKGDVVMANSESLAKGIKKVVKADVKATERKIDKKEIERSKGFVNGDDILPAAGSLVHIESGTIIPLPMDSVFDESNGEWVSTGIGGVDNSGTYEPPEGYTITDEGNLLKTVEGGLVQQVVLEVRPLDEVPPLGDMQTIDYQDPINGPAPAGGELEPLPPPPDGEVLPPPPVCTGCAYQPPSYKTTQMGTIQNAPRTPIRIKVNKGN